MLMPYLLISKFLPVHFNFLTTHSILKKDNLKDVLFLFYPIILYLILANIKLSRKYSKD
ncbi:hypothetical protein N786_03795 [Bacillus amyloliquefaciens UASWS BA1]|nr:hypothetical protein N786_03795 [Bacillus amyloliquefaciens UASWS BA1]